MEQVLQCYGKGIAAGIVLIAVMVLLFAGIRDEQGNRGIINIVRHGYRRERQSQKTLPSTLLRRRGR